MSDPDSRVNAKRAYDATRRREQARRSQDQITETAERFFLTQGYAATSIAAIAARADVSVDIIYKGFGGKPGLIRAIYQRALQGEGSTPAEERSDRLQATQTDPRKIIEGWGRFVTEIAPKATPIFLLIRSAAATDPELEPLVDAIHDDRLRRMTDNARRLHQAGHLRSGVTVATAADIFWTYSSPELYELLVIRRGMPLHHYGDFVAQAISAAVLTHNT